MLETAVANVVTILTASVNVENSSAIFVTQWHVLNQIVFKHGRDRVDGDVFADFLVLQPKFEVLLQFFEGTFRIELAWPQERHQEDVGLGWKCQIFFGCN